MLMRTIVGVLASASYLLVSVAPCPDLTLAEDERRAVRVVESVPVQAHTQSHDSQHQHHDADSVGPEAANEIAASQHHGGDESLAAQLSIPCPCGCGGKQKSSAAGGKLGPRILPDVSIVQYPESYAAVPPMIVALTERAELPPKPIPIANLIDTTVC